MGPQYNGPLGPDGQPLVQGADKKPSAIGNILMQTLTGVLGAMKGNQAVRQQQFKEQMEKDKLQTEKDQNEATIKFHHDQIDQQDKHFSLVQKAAKAVQDVQTALHKQEITKNLQAGIKLPGDTVTPGVGDPSVSQGGFSPINPAQATSEVHQLPGDLGSVTIDTPEVAATKDAAVARIAGAPKEEALIREQKARIGEQSILAAQNKQADLDRMNAQKMYDDERAKQNKIADDARADKHNAVLKDIARIQASSRGQANQLPENFDLDDFTAKVINGDTAKEDIPKLLGKQSGNVQLLLGKNGVKALSKDQVGLVGEFKMLVDSVSLMDQVIAQQPQTTNRISSHIQGGFSRLTNPDLSRSEQELAGRLSVIARNLMKEKGALSNKDIERATNMMPSSSEPVKMNITKRNNYVKELNSVIDAKLSDIPEKQRLIIKKKLGLLDIPMAGGQAVSTAVDPKLKSYADDFFGGDVEKAKTHIATQKVN